MTDIAGKERITYTFGCPSFKRGTYRAILKHSHSCDTATATDWEVRIIVRGKLKKRVTGKSNGAGGVTVADVRFSL